MGHMETKGQSLLDHVYVENKRSIRDWIEKFKTEADRAYLDGHPFEMQNELTRAGFTKVYYTNMLDWKEMHDWCMEIIGKEYYTWFGSTFWFSCAKDAILFDLKWNHDANN